MLFLVIRRYCQFALRVRAALPFSFHIGVKAIGKSIRRATKDRPANVGEMNLSWVPDYAQLSFQRV
jgi:hypothetical protein